MNVGSRYWPAVSNKEPAQSQEYNLKSMLSFSSADSTIRCTASKSVAMVLPKHSAGQVGLRVDRCSKASVRKNSSLIPVVGFRG